MKCRLVLGFSSNDTTTGICILLQTGFFYFKQYLMTTKKIVLSIIVAIVLFAAGYGYYQYNRPAANVAKLDAPTVSAKNLYADFTSNEPHANQLYLNKPLQVTGQVLEVKHG